ncbi:O-antigen ligase family protein [Fictibacillus sp. b24]|uniref:O-antigen ligase family protein n=1 Tax=Fictibacillus sp. b24 TaxID=3055863 RepID=UPI0025A28CDB|nr:O-antigen ligase family protein [Fictibacillus sp. b24]MDM5314942.1 O-antigen ligase family protein [Fictibacillus sp. b24]
MHKAWKKGEKVKLTLGLFLLGCMFVSTICASIAMNNYSYFLVSALILAYMGLYMKIANNRLKVFRSFKYVVIFGGVYFYGIYPFQQWMMEMPVLSYFTGAALIGTAGIDPQQYTRLIGSTYNPNFSVALLLLGLSFLFADCLKSLEKGTYTKLSIQLGAVCMFSHAILLTGSKAGFVTMLIIFVFFLLKWNKWISVALITLMLLNIPLITNLMPRSDELLVSAEIRKEIWRNSINLWQGHSLFGVTPIGFYEGYYYRFSEHVPHAHNMIIGFFTEYGALGGIALLMVLFINGYKIVYLALSVKNNKIYLDHFLLSLPVIFLTGIFDYVLYSPQVAIMIVTLLACWDQYTAKVSLTSINLVQIKTKVMNLSFFKSKKTANERLGKSE